MEAGLKAGAEGGWIGKKVGIAATGGADAGGGSTCFFGLSESNWVVDGAGVAEETARAAEDEMTGNLGEEENKEEGALESEDRAGTEEEGDNEAGTEEEDDGAVTTEEGDGARFRPSSGVAEGIGTTGIEALLWKSLGVSEEARMTVASHEGVCASSAIV